MISYKIISKNISQKPLLTSDEHVRAKIFERATSRAVKIFKPETRVVFGGQRQGVVVEVVLDIHSISWKGHKPFFIKVKFDDNGQVALVHTSSLKVKK